MQEFFAYCQPYAAEFGYQHWSQAVDVGLAFLNEVQRSRPTDYETPKGTPFYLLGIAAFHAHDYQTATFLFDAAASEDLAHDSTRQHSPALLFMELNEKRDDQSAKSIVEIAVRKLDSVIDNYKKRDGSDELTLPDIREHFLKRPKQEPNLRTLTTTFVSFLVEWDYRLHMIDLSKAASREPFFTHLFRGCLLFESLIKLSAHGKTSRKSTLGQFLKEPCILKALGIKKVCEPKDKFDDIIQLLKPNEPIQEAIKCTLTARNRLGHNLGLDVKLLNGEKYGQLANNIATSCLHAISRLYR